MLGQPLAALGDRLGLAVHLAYLISTRGTQFEHAESRSAEQRIDQLLDGGKLVLEPLTYIRGRSIPLQFFLVDEVQNLTPHEVKTILTRVGENTKIVLTGDRVNGIEICALAVQVNG